MTTTTGDARCAGAGCAVAGRCLPIAVVIVPAWGHIINSNNNVCCNDVSCNPIPILAPIVKGPRRTPLAPGSPSRPFIVHGPRRTPLVPGSPYRPSI
eukprot:6727697-Pyramimonas_sp.AAC.1